ncbi:MAG: MTH938/NDUFAF3 family protein [Chloroflexota bacterium]
MKPRIDHTTFGSIIIGRKVYRHDVVIGLDGEVRKREKELSKQLYGTSHVLSLAEAEDVFEEGAERLILGTGHFDRVGLSEEARTFFVQKGCRVDTFPTPVAMKEWNQAQGAVIGLFHTTC